MTSVACLLLFGTLPLVWGWHSYTVVSGSMEPLVRRGDVVVAQPYDGEPLRVGQVVTIAPAPVSRTDPAGSSTRPVTHRIVERLPDGRFRTRGDANPAADSRLITGSDVLARPRLIVPLLGRVSLLPADQRLLAGAFAAALVLAGLALARPRSPRGARLGHRPAVTFTLALLVVPLLTPHPPTATQWSRTTSSKALAFATKPAFYAQAVIASSPVSYWRLGDTGSVAKDAMGSTDLTISGSATQAARGRTGALLGDANAAIQFNSGGYANSPTTSPAGLSIAGPLSVSAWVRTTSAQTNSARLVIKYDGSKLNYLLAWSADGSALRFAIETGAGGTANRSTVQIPAASLNDGAWHLVTGVYDGAAIRLYANGADTADLSTTGTPATSTSAVSIVGNSNNLTAVDVDEVAIWNRALAAAEIQSFYQLATT